MTDFPSDAFFQGLHNLAQQVGMPGPFILEVWNSENGVRPTNPSGGLQYFGPAAVMVSTIAQQIDPAIFATFTLEQRLPYLKSLLQYQKHMNHDVAPDRPEVLYGINFLPAPMYAAGPNPPASTLIVARGGQYWADNPVFQPDADPAGITVGTLGRVLARKRATDTRLQQMLARYTAVTGEAYPGSGGVAGITTKKVLVVLAALGLLGAGAYYVASK
jgi:hypothetical protein